MQQYWLLWSWLGRPESWDQKRVPPPPIPLLVLIDAVHSVIRILFLCECDVLLLLVLSVFLRERLPGVLAQSMAGPAREMTEASVQVGRVFPQFVPRTAATSGLSPETCGELSHSFTTQRQRQIL